MITNELINFIKQQRDIGKAKIEIETILENNGWMKSDVEEAYYVIDGRKSFSGQVVLQDFTKSKEKTPLIILVAQIAIIFLFGIALSTFAPNAPWSSGSSFIITLLPILFPCFGIYGLSIGLRFIRKKDYSLLIVVLLIVSLGFISVVPIRMLSGKIAGLLNPQWTRQAKEQLIIEKQKHLRNNQIMQEQENRLNIE